MQKRKLCYDMICFLSKCQLLKEFNAVIAVQQRRLIGTFHLFDVSSIFFKSLFSPLSNQFFVGNSFHRRYHQCVC